MRLEGSFFEIIDRTLPVSAPAGAGEGLRPEASEAVFHVRLNPEHIIYKAHFPEQPITPGVIIVRMAVELLSESLGRRVRLVAAPNIKFSSPLFPMPSAASGIPGDEGREIDFKINIREEGLASVTVADAEVTYSKMLIRYE
ncbi:MAG: hypothetical protein IJ686_06080 [Bacteroidales bacterium]|nr:hypothetical protein [Bacteroidales bacterium]